MMYLGLYSGRIDGVNGAGDQPGARLAAERCGLPVTGTCDDRTRATLEEQYAALIQAA